MLLPRGHTASLGLHGLNGYRGRPSKKLREIVGSEDSLRQGKKQYPAVRKGRASNASTPIVLEFDRMTATLHLGVSAHEMAAPRLECGGERCDSAGKC